MSTHRDYLEGCIFICNDELSIGINQDDLGINYINVPVNDVMEEFSQGDFDNQLINSLKKKIASQQATINRLQIKLYKARSK